MWGHIIFHPQTCDRGGSDPYSHRVSGTRHSEDRGHLWGGCAQGWSSWAWVLCGCGGLWEAWVPENACDSRRFPREHHCGRVYPCPVTPWHGGFFEELCLRVATSWRSWVTSARREWRSMGLFGKCRGGNDWKGGT
jgi:hypothetical protein